MTDCIPTRQQDCTRIALPSTWNLLLVYLRIFSPGYHWNWSTNSEEDYLLMLLNTVEPNNFNISNCQLCTFMFSQLHHMHSDTQTCMLAQKQIYSKYTKILPQLKLLSNYSQSYSWLCWLFCYSKSSWIHFNLLQWYTAEFHSCESIIHFQSLFFIRRPKYEQQWWQVNSATRLLQKCMKLKLFAWERYFFLLNLYHSRDWVWVEV